MFSLTSLFRKTEQRNPTLPGNLSKSQVRQIQKVIDNARRDDGIPRTAQQSIPFQRMFPDGICRVTDRYYTKTNLNTQGIGIIFSKDFDTWSEFAFWNKWRMKWLNRRMELKQRQEQAETNQAQAKKKREGE